MAQQSHQKPSDLLRIEAYVRRRYDRDGWWTAMQVDQAVYAFGSRVENLLAETDKKGNPVHTLEGLLNTSTYPTPVKVSRLSRSDPRVSPRPQVRGERHA